MRSLSSQTHVTCDISFSSTRSIVRGLLSSSNILPRQQSRAFQEATEANLIRGQLTEINARFDKLKLRYGKHLRLLNELVAKHSAVHRQCGRSLNMAGWRWSNVG